MTNWNYTSKSTDFNPLFTESYDIILLETGSYLLRETSSMNYFDTPKNETVSSYQSKNTTNWGFPTKN